MDKNKNKNRSDMLAAGLKKLKQFRQKDGKGSSSQGKSSKRTNKSEQHESDADAADTVAKPTALLQVSEGETTGGGSTVSRSTEISFPSGLADAVFVSPVEPIVSEETDNTTTVAAHDAGLPIEVGTVDIPVFEEETTHDDMPHPSASVDTKEGTMVKLDLAFENKEMGQNSLLKMDDFPHIYLSQAREDQITDVQCRKLGMNQLDRGSETEFEVDGRLPFSGHGECDEPLEEDTLEVTSMERASSEAEQAISRDVRFGSTGEADGSVAASSQSTNIQAQDVIPCSPVGDEQGKSLKGNRQYLPEGSLLSQDLGPAGSLQRIGVSSSDQILSLARDGSPVKLSQLVEVIRSLDEDEYRLLLNSQELVSLEISGTDNLSPSYHPDIFEKLKEELYLTNFTKDIFYLQLSEQSDMHMESDRRCHQLLDEISVFCSSINGVHERNACLGEELAQCRSELQVLGSGRDELQNKLHAALLQVEEFSSRANELQTSLVRSQEDSTSLLSELAEYKNQVATLQADNENLNRTLYSLTDERNTLAQEKESSLSENEKLLMELARYKDLVVTSQADCEQLNGNIASVTEERKTLGDADNASFLYRGERDCRKSANFTFGELRVLHEDLKEYSDNLEATNIELGVLYEASKQHAYGIEAKYCALEVLYEALKKQESSLSSENAELAERLSEYQLRLTEMQSQIFNLQQRSDDMTSALNQQLESSQEAAERQLMLELQWKSRVSQIVETVRRLDESVGKVSNFTFSNNSIDICDLNSLVVSSVDSAINNILELQEKLEFTHAGHDAIVNSYKKVEENYNDMHRNNEFMVGILRELYNDLKELVIGSCILVDEPERNVQVEKVVDPLDYSKYKILIELLHNALGERLQLQSVNGQLNLELMNKTRDTEEISSNCPHSNAIQKLIEHVESVVKLEDSETDSDRAPGSHLELLVSLLVKKYKDIDEQVSNRGQEFGSKVTELTEVEEKIHQLDALRLQQEFEILTLKESLHQKEEALQTAHSELLKNISELEQSEQRVSSIREKLSIAVAKGKGLVVQRDGLKQSLAETSAELERLSQALQVKDSQLQELEIKLKAFLEAGQCVEALESELSYIRNSATALRESFLLKDSILQRIEEILEDLDLPEHFHSRDIIEKVDWLARSTSGHSLPAPDWDQKSSVGGSYSDAGFVTVDAWKEDAQPTATLGDDLRRKYEDLESKFYGLAEQNEMLEQSLMERDHLVQRWEELLDRIDMPLQLQSMEPVEKIEWLGGALSEANHDKISLQKKIDDLQNYLELVVADLEESEKRISDLEANLQSAAIEREHLSERLDALTSDHHNLAAKAARFELENEKLQIQVSGLHEELDKKTEEEENLLKMEVEIRRLQHLVCDVLQDPEAKDLVSDGSSTASLEGLLKKLIENYTNLKSMDPKPVDIEIDQTSQEELASLKKELEEVLHNLTQVEEERDEHFGMHQSLLHEVQTLERKGEELRELLKQEEQKSASVREKLNVAVRKGKSLVQQRDSLKKTIEEMNAELERSKSELSNRNTTLADYELKMRDFSAYPKRVEALEADSLFLRNHLTETEHMLEEKGHILKRTLNAIADIDTGVKIDTSDPVEKLGQIRKVCHDLHAAVASSKQESQKSKRAAELLLAEVNEVQERNDRLQEDLANISIELTEVTKDRDVAEAAKLEVLSRLEDLSTVQSEGKRKQYSELMVLQSSVNELTEGINDIHNLLYNVFQKDLEFMHNLEVNIKSCFEEDDAQDVGLPNSFSSNLEDNVNFQSMDTSSVANMQEPIDDDAIVEVCGSIWHHLQDLTTEITALKEKLIVHSKSFHEQGCSIWNVLGILHKERNCHKESFDAMRRNIMHIESIGKEKDMEIVVLRRNIAFLYEACANSVVEIENKKTELSGNSLSTADLELADGGLALGGKNSFFFEECIKTMADKLLSTMKDFSNMKAEIAEGSQREMKITVANLQKELQEKDIQKDQICMELVGQIKSAEAAAMNYSRDLQSSKILVHDLEKELEVSRDENKSLHQRVKELQDVQTNSVELHDRVKSLTDVLSSKDQEIEAFMRAHDEKEVQMEELTKKIEELEKVLQQKNTDLEKLEASHGKVVKKLSITAGKFNELRDLSESLLAKVEELQSQLQDRDAEISFLRQEVTKCTDDLIAASQVSYKGESDAIYEFLTWFEGIVSSIGLSDLHFDTKNIQVPRYKELIQKNISSIISELKDLRGVAQSRDDLLQAERTKVEELTHSEETLKKTLHEKESLLNLLEGVGDVGQKASVNSEIVEVEPVINKRAVAGTSMASQVRSLRKGNNDQVDIPIDTEDVSNSRLEDEDKVHGFKSLTTSRIVPRFTRPITDIIDGLWVSCDRALMQQPVLRLGIMIYWTLLHTLLAAFVF